MNESRFDDFAKALAAARSRRQVIGALAGGVAAAVLGLPRANQASAGSTACLPPGALCSGAGQCCSGSCTGGRCPLPGSPTSSNSSGCSTPLGAPCRSSADCCNATCLNGLCSACLAPGAPCGTNGPCCTGTCTAGSCTVAGLASCQPTGMACRTGSDCCSGTCTGGVCGCQPDGTGCGVSSQCCSGTCTGAVCGSVPNANVYSTALQYVIAFYPRWLTYEQSLLAPHNRLLGPQTVNAVYREVVAINDDTLYASSFTDVSSEPVVLTVPPTSVSYSLLVLDVYGDIFQTNIPKRTPGTYGLTAPGWSGTLPRGIIQVPMPFNFTQVIFRADKFSSDGTDQTALAEQFRETILIATLSQYLANPTQGATSILPVEDFAISYKLLADGAVALDPILFLTQLQTAMHASSTPPLTGDLLALSNQFDALFGNGTFSPMVHDAFAQGTRDAHAQIVSKYLTSTGPTNWINFSNIGNWGTDYIDRSGIAEFLQYGNDHPTAAYYHAFQDASGSALDGSARSYVLTFPPGGTPPVSRFWSVTAYTPDTVELVANPANKFLVANYTPGLVIAPDGSISIHLSQTQPPGVATANWLPVPNGPFNIMLRAYGPVGSALRSQYVPPGITAQS